MLSRLLKWWFCSVLGRVSAEEVIEVCARLRGHGGFQDWGNRGEVVNTATGKFYYYTRSGSRWDER